MRIGIWQDLRNPPPWRRDWSELYSASIERVEEAERLGLDSVWLSEHHFFEDGYLPQTLTYAGALAARTSRITIGTAILLAPLRPAIDIAEQAAIVDILSNGRFELGLGAGYRIPEFTAFGTTMEDRMDRLEDRTREVRRLYDEGGITPGPVQDRMPIWVGGGSPRAARIAGALGEGLMWGDVRSLPHYTKALEAGGHDPASARLATGVGLVVADDPERAWARIAPHLEYQWETYTRYGTEGLQTDQSATAGVPEASAVTADGLRSDGPEMLLPRFDVVTAEEAVRRLRLWMADLPIEHAFFWDSIAGMDDDLVGRHIELLATQVAPALAGV
jgi:alkanesulfonate monooxygenase SsuD/methylene tetrahydromethanopterin reductase-like flavin-dependent oxidoreductase (luciferase family)